jgi:hypothetical protein
MKKIALIALVLFVTAPLAHADLIAPGKTMVCQAKYSDSEGVSGTVKMQIEREESGKFLVDTACEGENSSQDPSKLDIVAKHDQFLGMHSKVHVVINSDGTGQADRSDSSLESGTDTSHYDLSGCAVQ